MYHTSHTDQTNTASEAADNNDPLARVNINPELPREQQQAARQLLEKWRHIFSTHEFDISFCDAVKHVVVTEVGTRPTVVNPYRVPLALQDQVHKQLQAMCDANIIQSSKSEWAYGTVVFEKTQTAEQIEKPHSIRIVTDFRPNLRIY